MSFCMFSCVLLTPCCEAVGLIYSLQFSFKCSCWWSVCHYSVMISFAIKITFCTNSCLQSSQCTSLILFWSALQHLPSCTRDSGPTAPLYPQIVSRLSDRHFQKVTKIGWCRHLLSKCLEGDFHHIGTAQTILCFKYTVRWPWLEKCWGSLELVFATDSYKSCIVRWMCGHWKWDAISNLCFVCPFHF